MPRPPAFRSIASISPRSAATSRPRSSIAISSGGAAPVLARLARAKIEAVLPPAFARLGVLAARFKEAMRQRFPDMTARRRVLEQLFTGPAADLVYAGREAEAEAAFAAALDSKPASTGMVYLVGAGPGAADLLTLRAQRLLGEADTIVYDRLVSPDVLALRRRDAHTIFVGKTGAQHSLPQAEISALLARLAAEGQRVVRLKGGDPLIFGHAAEEMAALAAAGIAFEIVPGVTAALACAASAGIALTHKDAARTVTFASGHEAPDWAALAGSGGTIALYMSAASLTPLFRGLTAAGLAADTPAALIENGGTAHARVLALPFAALLDAAPGWLRDAPALLLLGAAVAHRVVSSPQG